MATNVLHVEVHTRHIPTPAATCDPGRPRSRPSPRASCRQPRARTSARWGPCAQPPTTGAARRPPRAGPAAADRPAGGSPPVLPPRLAAEPPGNAPPPQRLAAAHPRQRPHPRTTPPRPHEATAITLRTHLTNGLKRASTPQSPATSPRPRPPQPTSRSGSRCQRTPGREGPHLAGAPHLARPAADRPPRTEPGAAGHPARGSHPALPQRLAAQPPSIAPATPRPTPPPGTHLDYLSHSLN